MTKLRNSDSAIYDKIAAVRSIRDYFQRIESPELARKHVEEFRADFAYKQKLIMDNPKLYTIRDDGHFKDSLRKYRSFSVHWFIVFYSYEEALDEVIIWFIRSSRSDYSNVLFLDQSRTIDK